MSKFLKRFAADQSGATTAEYSLMIGLMAMVVAGCVANLGMRVA